MLCPSRLFSNPEYDITIRSVYSRRSSVTDVKWGLEETLGKLEGVKAGQVKAFGGTK